MSTFQNSDLEFNGQILPPLSQIEDVVALMHIDFDTDHEDYYHIGGFLAGKDVRAFSAMSYDDKVVHFADTYVIPEDRQAFIQNLQRNAVIGEIAANSIFQTRFRCFGADRPEWYEVRFTHHQEHSQRRCAVIVLRNIEVLVRGELTSQAEIKRLMAKEQARLTTFHNIIHSGMWSMLVNRDSTILQVTWSDEYRKLLGYRNEADFPNTIDAWLEKLYPADRDAAETLFWKGLRDRSGETIFDCDFRVRNKNGEYRWYHAAGRIEPNDEETFLYVGIFVDSSAEHRNEELQREQKKNFDIIEILASEYTSVYYIDLTTNELTPYTMNAETESEFGSIFRSGIRYSDAFTMYVDTLVSDHDKAMMLKAGSIANIIDELATKKTFITTYQNTEGKFSEMKFVKVGDDMTTPTAVALGFAEKDEEIRREQAIAKERQRNFDIIEILASEYTSVYYIDLTTDELDTYTMNAETESKFGNIFRSGIHYSDAFRMYVDTQIMPEDKAMMLKAGSIGNIMTELRSKKTFITTYKNVQDHYSEMKFVKVGDEEGFPKAVALGFADKDAELRAKEEETRILQRNIDIIEILASEYTSVYYIDLTTDELDTYTMNDETESEFGSIFRNGIKYSEAFRMYVNTLVYTEDRAMMLKAGSVYNIITELVNKKTFITTYRDANGRYCEMKFVKVGNEANPQAVALGFANKDMEVRAELERKTQDARDRAVISGLSDDFGCVVYVNFDTFDEIHYRFDPMFAKHIPGWTDINKFDERLNSLINTIMHPDDRDDFYAATRPEIIRANVIRNGLCYVNFRTLVDGVITFYQAQFVRDDTSPDHVIAGFHNVDETVRRELNALEKAESANKAKSTFLFNMSHDIRTPMNAITGFTRMAKKHIDDTEAVMDYLTKIETAGDQLLSLINQVLEMSQIESGKMTLKPRNTDVQGQIRNIASIYGEHARTKGVQLTLQIGTLAHRFVFTDADRINQAISNLLGNAIKYTPEGGMVTVSAEEKPLPRADRSLYVFVIADTGLGMSQDFLEHIFEEFSRESNSTVSRIQGTGLGMSIVKRIVDMMDGTIDIASEKGHGTTVTLSLPLPWSQHAEQADTDSPADTAVSLEGMRVLLVEDNEMNMLIASELLAEYGIIVDTADDGDVAVRKVSESTPGCYDLVLMDVQMPRMNGYEATSAIRALDNPALASLPIIALSANAFDEDRRRSLEAGMNAHLAKPIDITALLHTLANFRAKSLIE